jgi:DNA-binding CsgD family transcriptional regulator
LTASGTQRFPIRYCAVTRTSLSFAATMNAQSPLTAKPSVAATSVHAARGVELGAHEWTTSRRSNALLLREPRAGSALEVLLGLSAAQREQLVVVTDNPCPEYALDLLALNPGALFFGKPPTLGDIERALAGINAGTPPSPPMFSSNLLPSERAILRFLPSGACDKRIARALDLSHRTIRNRLASVLEKLHLENRTQLAMYYSGQWQWLPRYREALHPVGASFEA